MRADMSALVTVRASLHDKAKQNLENLSRYTLDLCEGFIHITLGEIENIPLWLSLGDKIAINLSMMTVPFAHIIYGRSLLEGKEYLKLIIQKVLIPYFKWEVHQVVQDPRYTMI